jgi:hypothetical protein
MTSAADIRVEDRVLKGYHAADLNDWSRYVAVKRLPLENLDTHTKSQ